MADLSNRPVLVLNRNWMAVHGEAPADDAAMPLPSPMTTLLDESGSLLEARESACEDAREDADCAFKKFTV